MTDSGRVAASGETGSRADASSQQAVSTKGFDPARITALADYMRRSAKNHSESSRILAQAKSLRQARNPPRDDLYMWAAPEQTVEWEIAGILDAIATEARRAETAKTGSVHEGAGLKGIAQTQSGEQ